MSNFIPASWNPRSRKDFLSLVLGLTMGLGFLKFATPSNLAEMAYTPDGIFELIFTSWPLSWGYLLYCPLLCLFLYTNRSFISVDRSWFLLPCITWLCWNGFSCIDTIDVALTKKVMINFCVISIAWYAGCSVDVNNARVTYFLSPIFVGFLYVIWSGFGQKFGGLEETRQMIYSETGWESKYPPEFLYRIARDRIFATLTYPNSFAALIVLILPVVAVFGSLLVKEFVNKKIHLLASAIILFAGLCCLWWTGSKTAFLVALFQILLTFLFATPLKKNLRIGLGFGAVFLGLIVFFIQFSSYFEEGAKSLTQGRFGYWRAAKINYIANPLTGSGPGTFFRAYQNLKRPDDEMARLAHNDYLQQASDAGSIAFISYSVIICLAIFTGFKNFPKLKRSKSKYWMLYFCIWIGFLGWALQSLLEWTLYIPAISCVAFFFSGLLTHHYRVKPDNPA